jgi:hypothetical protein
MANQNPTVQELQALIIALQGQVTALQNAAPAAPAAPTAAVLFAETPQTLGVDDLIDYSTKRGKDIYNQGCEALDDKALTNGFNMTPNETVVFIEALERKADSMGWSKGTKQITKFTNRDDVDVDIIKNYGQIDMATLKTACERFCKAGEADSTTRARQNNKMMSMCLANSLSLSAKVQLLTYKNEYIFDGVEYAPLMYKVIMRLATIDSVATTQTLRDNLQNLSVFAATVSGDIDKINTEFNKNYSQILARGATVDDPLNILFNAYLVVPCYHFKTYMKQKHNGYLDGTLTLTHEVLMAFAKAHFDYLKNTGQWGAKSPDDEKIVAMAAEINALKGQLKLDPKLSAIAKDKKKEDKGENKGKKKNKKDTSNKKYQKKDEAWKKVPPKEGDPKEKQLGKYTFQWCEHHMAWTAHRPQDCTLNPKHKDYKGKKNDKANSAVVASSAIVPSPTTTLNNRYAALLATLATMNEDE